MAVPTNLQIGKEYKRLDWKHQQREKRTKRFVFFFVCASSRLACNSLHGAFMRNSDSVRLTASKERRKRKAFADIKRSGHSKQIGHAVSSAQHEVRQHPFVLRRPHHKKISTNFVRVFSFFADTELELPLQIEQFAGNNACIVGTDTVRCTRLTFGNNRCKANPRISTIFVVRKSYNSQKAQVTRVSCAFLLLYLVFLSLDKIFEFNSCISALFSKNRS